MSDAIRSIGSAAPAAEGDRTRWIALYVLCVGMLMIVLDATIVNVALPSIQSDLGFSQSSLAWVVNAYLIPFGGLLLLAGRLGDLISRRGVFLVGLGDLHGRLAPVRPRPEPGGPDRSAVRAGCRRGTHLGGDPGNDRDDVPRAS
jgi:Major Facilitator Superfamily